MEKLENRDYNKENYSNSGVDYDENSKRNKEIEEKNEETRKIDEYEAEFLLIDDISKEKYDELCKKEELNDDEIKEVVKYVKQNKIGAISLDLVVLTDEQAKILSMAKKIISLNNLKEITDEQVKILSMAKKGISLNSLKEITDKQSEELGKCENAIFLRGLTKITDDQLKNILKAKYIIDLVGLTDMTDSQFSILRLRYQENYPKIGINMLNLSKELEEKYHKWEQKNGFAVYYTAL